MGRQFNLREAAMTGLCLGLIVALIATTLVYMKAMDAHGAMPMYKERVEWAI